MGDWANPYKTMLPRYEADQLRALRQIMRNGHIYKGYKPVYWCLDCRSALAEAEVEYEDKTSPAIDVRFPVSDDSGSGETLRADRRCTCRTAVAVAIWTTTPWTLPANQAVAVHRDYQYSLLEARGSDRDGVHHRRNGACRCRRAAHRYWRVARS